MIKPIHNLGKIYGPYTDKEVEDHIVNKLKDIPAYKFMYDVLEKRLMELFHKALEGLEGKTILPKDR